MEAATTLRILSDNARQIACGQNCVDWAVLMLEKGHDGANLVMLAGMSPPFNHFEVAGFRDRALQELGIKEQDEFVIFRSYAAELLSSYLSGEIELPIALATIKDLYVASNYQNDLRDFYLLYFAYTDLQEQDHQWYWPEATNENIVPIINRISRAFLESSVA